MAHRLISAEQHRQFAEDGVTIVCGLLSPDWVARMREAVDQVMAAPDDLAVDRTQPSDTGRFYTTAAMWTHCRAFSEMETGTGVGEAGAELTGSRVMRLYKDNLAVKEPRTATPTRWHQDIPYFWIDGLQICTAWITLDDIGPASGSLRFIRGSHRWGLLFGNAKEGDGSSPQARELAGPMPEVEAEHPRDIVSFDLNAGDALLYSARIIHGSGGNRSERRRRAISIRMMGDDVVWRRRTIGDPDVAHDFVEGAPALGERHPVLWSAPAHSDT